MIYPDIIVLNVSGTQNKDMEPGNNWLSFVRRHILIYANVEVAILVFSRTWPFDSRNFHKVLENSY